MFVIGLFTFKNIKLKFVIFVPLVSPNSIAKILWQASLWFHWCYSKILIFRYFLLRLHRFNISAVTVRVFWPYWDGSLARWLLLILWVGTARLFFQGHSCLTKLHFCFLYLCMRASFVREQCTLLQLPALTRLSPRKTMWCTIGPKAIYPKACGNNLLSLPFQSFADKRPDQLMSRWSNVSLHQTALRSADVFSSV